MEFQNDGARIYALKDDGSLLAEVTFPQIREGVVEIDHTFVDPSLRGQGIAAQLLEQLVAYLRSNKLKAELTCPYAIAYFPKHPEDQDVLVG